MKTMMIVLFVVVAAMVCAPVSAELVHQWGFDGNYSDAFNTANGTAKGNATTTTTTPKFGTASLTGLSSQSSYVSLSPYFAPPGTTDGGQTTRAYSVSLWLNGWPTGRASWYDNELFGWFTSSSGHNEQFRLNYQGYIVYGRYTGSWSAMTSTVAVPSTGWQLLTLTVSGNNAVAYLNGEQAVSGTVTGLPVTTSVAIGGNPFQNYYYPTGAKIDDVAVWNGALTSIEARSLYQVTTVEGLESYDSIKMDRLFDVFAGAGSKIYVDGDKTWRYVDNLTTHTEGQAWSANGVYYVKLGASSGVSTIPEPGSTMLLCMAGAGGLLCAAWKRRK